MQGANRAELRLQQLSSHRCVLSGTRLEQIKQQADRWQASSAHGLNRSSNRRTDGRPAGWQCMTRLETAVRRDAVSINPPGGTDAHFGVHQLTWSSAGYDSDD